MSKFSNQFVDTLTDLTFMLRKGTVLTHAASRDLMWDKPGIRKYVLEVTESPDIEPIDVCAVALGCAADLSIETPALMPTSNRSWQHTQTGQPAYRECRHGSRIATNAPKDETDSAVCGQCDSERIARTQVPNWRAEYQATKATHAPATRRALHGDTP